MVKEWLIIVTPRYVVVPSVTILLALTANIAIIFGVDSVCVHPPVLGVQLPVEVPGLRSEPDPSVVSLSTVVSCCTVIASRRLVPNNGVSTLPWRRMRVRTSSRNSSFSIPSTLREVTLILTKYYNFLLCKDTPTTRTISLVFSTLLRIISLFLLTKLFYLIPPHTI